MEAQPHGYGFSALLLAASAGTLGGLYLGYQLGASRGQAGRAPKLFSARRGSSSGDSTPGAPPLRFQTSISVQPLQPPLPLALPPYSSATPLSALPRIAQPPRRAACRAATPRAAAACASPCSCAPTWA